MASGDSPASVYIRQLPSARQDALLVRMKRYANTGALRVPLQLNVLRDGLLEFKLSEGPRVIFYHAGQRSKGLVVLTHGFTKKTKKTPPGEIARALNIREEVEGGRVSGTTRDSAGSPRTRQS